MKQITNCVLLCLFLVFVNVSANTAYTGMRTITSLQFTADMKAGINLCNTLDAYPAETSWGNPQATLALITAWKQKGFKTLRLPVTWKDHLGAAPNYTIDPTWLARVEAVANYAFANDMYVIINAHHEDWYQPTTANQTIGAAKLAAVWTQIANRFKNYGDYLIFETMNEPRVYGAPDEWTGGNADSRSIINAFNLAAVNAIRNTGGNNATRFIMTPTYGANGSSAVINSLVIPNNDSLVLVSVHNYTPYEFCLAQPGVSTWGTATEKSQLGNEFDLLYNKFIKNGRGVVIGEWGAENKSNTSTLVSYYDFFVNSCKSRQIATINWMYVFDRYALTWGLPTVADANVNPFKPNYVAVTSVSVSPTKDTVAVAGTIQLTATVAPLNATTNAVTWTSSNMAVATVSSTGTVTGKATGTAIITATTQNNGKSATSTVVVQLNSGTQDVLGSDMGIKFYPNPVIDILNIKLLGFSSQIELFAIDGKKLMNINTKDSQIKIDMTKFKSGVYILKVIASGQEITQKIVK